jgi:hypothetical protein
MMMINTTYDIMIEASGLFTTLSSLVYLTASSSFFNFLAQQPIYIGNSWLHNGLVSYKGWLSRPGRSA